MQIIEDSTFGYNSAYWTNDQLLNENSAITDNVNAKYQGFLSTSFKIIRMCSGDPDSNCTSHTFDQVWNNAKELFGAGYLREPSLDQSEILNVFSPEKGTYSVSFIPNSCRYRFLYKTGLNCIIYFTYEVYPRILRNVECSVLDSILSATTIIRQDGDIA